MLKSEKVGGCLSPRSTFCILIISTQIASMRSSMHPQWERPRHGFVFDSYYSTALPLAPISCSEPLLVFLAQAVMLTEVVEHTPETEDPGKVGMTPSAPTCKDLTAQVFITKSYPVIQPLAKIVLLGY